MRKKSSVLGKKKVDRAAIGRKSKRKGNNFERAVATLLSTELGVDFRRVPASGGLDLKGDICYKDFSKPMPVIVDTKNNKSLIGAAMRKEIVKTIEDAQKSGIEGKYFLVLHDHILHEDFALLPVKTFIGMLNGKIKF